MLRPIVLLATLCPVPALAFVEVQFGDGVPWDVFDITATSCPISDAELVIDLRTSVAGVIVDTTYGGPGFQDPLPAELFAGRAILDPVPDGARRLRVFVDLLDRETPIGLRMDMDETLGPVTESRITVSRSEMAGATVLLTVAGESTTGTFDENGLATVPLPATVADCALLF